MPPAQLGMAAGVEDQKYHCRSQPQSLVMQQPPCLYDKYLKVVDRRVDYLYKDTLMVAASVLDPEYHYKFNFGKDLKYVKALSKAIRKMADPAEYIVAIPQIAMYMNSRGPFDASDARDAARQVSATDWWVTFGVDTEILQKYAILIVSQCTSSSGCERNWSTFALVHTQVRNRLGFEKLHKMVYCHYNLGLRIRQSIEESKEIEVDACAMLMDVSLHDHENPILDWLTNSMSESVPLLDECDNYYHHSPCPVVVEVVQKRKNTKKRSLSTIEDSEEEEEEEEEQEDSEEEEEQDGGSDIDGDEGNHGVLPPNNSTTLPRKSTRKRRRTIKAMSNMKNKQV